MQAATAEGQEKKKPQRKQLNNSTKLVRTEAPYIMLTSVHAAF